MRVLVTRPQPGADRTAARLAARGYEPLQLPLFEGRTTATPDDLPDPDRVRGILATSARALSVFGAAGAPEPYRSVPVYAVGPATAEAAQQTGFHNVHTGAGTAHDLARELIARQTTPPQETGSRTVPAPAFLYLAGRPRRTVIEDSLKRVGIGLRVLECYQMAEISYSTHFIKMRVLTLPPHAILLYSTKATERFVTLATGENLGDALDSTWFCCLSAEVAAALPPVFRARARIAARPDEDSLLASLPQLG